MGELKFNVFTGRSSKTSAAEGKEVKKKKEI